MKPKTNSIPTPVRTLGRAVPLLLVLALLGSSVPTASALGKSRKAWERKSKTESPIKKRSGLFDRVRTAKAPMANVAASTTKKRQRLFSRLRETKPEATRTTRTVRVRATAQSRSAAQEPQAQPAVRKKRVGLLARIFKPGSFKNGEQTAASAASSRKRPSGPVAPNAVQAPPRFNDALLSQAKSSGGNVVVDISRQRATLYVGGKVALDTPISTARSGKHTPRGSFGVGQRVRTGKISTIYNVEMPYWIRLGDSAYGMHAGYLPGYPASAGCIRMPSQAAQKLYDATGYGTRVRITGG